MEDEHSQDEPEAPPPEVAAATETSGPQPAGIQEALRNAEAERDALRAQLSAAAVGYRTALLAGAPEVPPDLVNGETPDEIDRSFARAHAIVQAIRERTSAMASASGGPPPAIPVPAGAPVRGAPDTSAMSAAEKIRYALSR